MKLVIDDEQISYDGSEDELWQDIAKLLVACEKEGSIPARKALRIIGVYSLLVKNGLL